jgi:hypothetical protein
MGRYSNWKTRLGLLIVLSAVLVPVGIYTVGEAMPYLNLLQVTGDPQNMVLSAMEVVDREYDEEGNWEYCVWRLDLNFTNPLTSPVIVPRARLSINYMEGVLGEGWISTDYLIPGETSQIVKAYLKTTAGEIFNDFMIAFLMGQPLDLKADFEAYILIDGMLGEPYIGVKFPTVLNFPLPTETQGTPPFITEISRSAVTNDTAVTITAKGYDFGTGIAVSKILYTVNGSGWYETDMTGPAWDLMYLATPLDPPGYPIKSTDTDNPQTYVGSIGPLPAFTDVSFKIYFEDYADNIDHQGTGNYIESELYTYTVPNGTTLDAATLGTFEEEIELSFLMKFIEYTEESGINLLHWLYTQDKDLLSQLPYMDDLSIFFYENDVDFEYWMSIFINDFKKSVEIMADSGVSAGKLMETLEVDFQAMWQYILPRLILEYEYTEEGRAGYTLVDMAQEIWANGVNDPEYEDLKDKFEALGITNSEMYSFVNTIFLDLYVQEIGALHIGGYVIPPDVPNFLFPQWNWIPWTFLPTPAGFDRPAWENFIDLIRRDDGTNYHLVAANLMIDMYTDVPDPSDALLSILAAEQVPPGNPFPLDDLYPYTHQLSTICIFIPLAVVSYLVIKRELISHRNIKKDLAIKRTFKKKASTSSYK